MDTVTMMVKLIACAWYLLPKENRTVAELRTMLTEAYRIFMTEILPTEGETGENA